MAATTPAVTNAAVKPSKALHIALWVVQVLVGLMFLFGGFMKVAQPIAVLTAKMGWPGAVPEALVRFIGTSEVLGGLGMILPAATRLRPVLTPIAALGLVTVMVLAAAFHLSRGELFALPVNFVLGGLAAFVAWGRLKKAPIAGR